MYRSLYNPVPSHAQKKWQCFTPDQIYKFLYTPLKFDLFKPHVLKGFQHYTHIFYIFNSQKKKYWDKIVMIPREYFLF